MLLLSGRWLPQRLSPSSSIFAASRTPIGGRFSIEVPLYQRSSLRPTTGQRRFGSLSKTLSNHPVLLGRAMVASRYFTNDKQKQGSETISKEGPTNPLTHAEMFSRLHSNYTSDTLYPLPRKRKLSPETPTIQSDALNSTTAVWMAIAGNSVVTMVKLAAHLATGSSTMLSEAIHSFADTLNQCLLAVGIARAKRPPSAEYPYGHARETYVWALISAVGIFFLGAGLTIREGIQRMTEADQPIENIGWCGVALFVSMAIEGLTFVMALIALRRAARVQRMKLWEYIRSGPDPLAVAVLLEDGAAVLGVVIAGISLGLVEYTGQHIWDGVGSLAVGALLGVVAIFLIGKNRDMLVGRGVNVAQRKDFIRLLQNDPVVRHVSDVKAEVIGVGVLRFKAEIDFDGMEVARNRLKRFDMNQVYKEHAQSPQALELFLVEFGGQVIDQLADEVDRVEKQVTEQFPEAAYVDLEAD